MESSVNGQSQAIWIGTTRYLFESSAGTWQVEQGGPSIPVPSFIWDYFKPFIAPRIIGTQTMDGQKSHVLVFFGESGSTGVWFRLWVDSQGLVRRAEMRAPGHFMDDHYYDFDRSISIKPPVS